MDAAFSALAETSADKATALMLVSRILKETCLLRIGEIEREDDLNEVKKLFGDYASSLEISLDFQDFDQELAHLPGDYSPPDGSILIASWEGEVAGCVALRKFANGICEMKRLYTKPQFRTLGIGRALCEAIIVKARRIGYERMRLDTLPSMETARGLYASLGFKEIEPYRYNPIEGAHFMELVL